MSTSAAHYSILPHSGQLSAFSGQLKTQRRTDFIRHWLFEEFRGFLWLEADR
jgi:hypothetical protein